MNEIFFSAGEPSGDLHAAELIAKLRERDANLKIVGYGGPKMQEVGCELHRDLTQLAIMWFGRALWNIRTFIKIVDDADAYFAQNKVDAVVLVDFPGLNWWIARKAKKHGIPVFYFMPPQIWSWATWRIRKMKKLVDHVLCCLPFEKRWFENHGCHVEYIGHPFFEEVRNRKLDETFIKEIRGDSIIDSAADSTAENGKKKTILAILPGSRNQEVHLNFEEMLSAALLVQDQRPDVSIVVAAFKESQKQWIQERLVQRSNSQHPNLVDSISVYVGKTPEIMHAADCSIAVSGSVSLELLASGCPAIIYYRISRFAHFVQRFFRRSRYITLVNLLAVDMGDRGWGIGDGEDESSTSPRSAQGAEAPPHPLSPTPYSPFYQEYPIPAEPSDEDKRRMVFPEFLTNRDRSGEVAQIVLQWLNDPNLLRTKREQLAELLRYVDSGENTMDLAADALLRNVQ